MPNIYFHALFTKYHTNIYVKRLKMDTLKPKVAFGGGYSIVFSHPINKIYRCQDSYDFSSAEIAMLLPPTQSMESCKSARFQIEITAAYRLRNPQSSDYYRCVEDYFETFVSIYDEHFSRQYGFWRPYLEKVFHRKRYWRGFLFIIMIMLGLVIIAGIAAAGALESLNTMQTQGGTVDINTISNLAAKYPVQKGYYYKVIFLYIICCWLFSVIDAYRLGKRKNSATQVS
jgi:hypothetical protein